MSVDKEARNADRTLSRASLDSRTLGSLSDRQANLTNAEEKNPAGCKQPILRQDLRVEGQVEKATLDNWDEDPRNPRLWPAYRKWTSAAVVSLYTLVS